MRAETSQDALHSGTNLGLVAGMVIALIVWVSLVNPIIDSAAPGAGRYTPVGASASVTADPASYLLSPLAGGLLLLAYAAIFIAAGHLTVTRRDVT